MFPPLVCPATSFVTDPLLGDTVTVDRPPLHSPTTGPNRYTAHVPTETTRLSLGAADPQRWKTDVGITGYTDSHIDLETKKNDKTVVSLGTATEKSATSGHGEPKAPVATHGYSMVTSMNAWHEAKNQHYFLSQAGDISLRTMGAGKRAVIQADKGFVNLNAGKTASVSGGGVSIGAAEELELEDVVYGGEWESKKHKSAAPGAGRTALAAGAALASLHDLIVHKKRPKFDPGNFAPLAKEEIGDRAKWLTNALSFGFAANKVYSLVSAPAAPEKCVKLHAQKNLAAIAGNDLGFFGRIGASLGAAVWTTVSAGVSVSLKALGLGGVGGTFVALKGFRKCEIGSDWGKTFVGAEKEISVTAGAELTVSAKQTAHVAAFGDKGLALFGGTEQVWLGTKAGQGWGLLCNDEGLAVGEASNAGEMKKAKIKPKKASIRIEKDKIVLRGGHKPTITFSSGNCTVASPQIRFVAKSGQCTVNGAGMILLK